MSTLLLLLLLNSFANAAKHRCTYGESCWPSNSTWASFNASISGRLIRALPPAAPCHTDHYNASLCAIATANWTNGYWRADQPGAMEATQWEDGDQQCYIDSPKTAPCQQGLVPVLVADTRNVQDIQKAVSFAVKYRLKTVIKNTGHDYLGRSSGAGTFAIWTHHIRGINFTNSFVPDKCKEGASAGPAVTVQAGEYWPDVYKAADEHNVIVVGGAALSVGAAGGWVMGGGHSPLSQRYGLGVDNVLQFNIVTADGKYLAANSCQNQDLFWALRGGGGGTFGVVVSVTYKTHPPLKSFEVMTMYGTNLTKALATKVLEFVPTSIDAGYSSYLSISSSGSPPLTVLFMNPQTSTDPTPNANRTFAPLLQWAQENNETLAVDVVYSFPSFEWFFNTSIGDVAIALNVEVGSRLLPRTTFSSSKAGELADIAMASPYVSGTFNMIAGGAVNKFAPDSVSVHPAWRTALGVLEPGTAWPNGSNKTVTDYLKGLVTNTTQTLSKLVGPGAGSYFNEADPQEPDWKNAFWGPHYDRLLSIKKQVDPHLFWWCNRCVGSDL